MLPKISSYGEYSSDNYGAHSLLVSFENFDLYFSYKTIIAFKHKGKLIVRQNDWHTTTGKHLNWIDGGNKKDRLSSTVFEAELSKVLKAHKLI